MILKRTLVSILALFASFVSPLSFGFAGVLPGQLNFGLDVGYASRSGTLNSDYRTTATSPGALSIAVVPAGSAIASVSTKISDSGTSQGIFAGYTLNWMDFFFGVEGYVDWARYENAKLYRFANANATVAAVSPVVSFPSEATYIQGTRYGGVFRAGMEVLPFFKPYARIGAEYSDHEVSLTSIIFGAAPGLPLTFDHFSYKKGLWAWVFGAGVEVPLFSEVVGLRAEYNYSPGRNLDFNDNLDLLGSSHHYKAKTHSGKLALVINID